MHLQTLEEHNQHVLDMLTRESNNPRYKIPNGIACPDCGEELVDTDSTMRWLTTPPEHPIICLTCDYKGRRF